MGPAGLGTINIGNTGTSAAGTVNVGIGGTVNIGTNSTGATMTIGNTAGSTLLRSLNNYIGNTGIGATIFQSGTTQLNGPLTLGSAPASSGQLGYSITPVVSPGVVMSAGSTSNIASTGTLPNGTWLIIGYVIISGTTLPGQVYIWIGDNSNVYANRKTENQTYLGSGQAYVATVSYVGTGTGPFLLVAQANGSNANGGGTLYCTRIA